MSDAGNSPKKNNNRRRNNYKKRNGPRKNNSANPQNKTPGQKSGQKRRFSQNKNRRPKTLTPARILQKYDNLLEQYLTARKKFFDIFGRANNKQLQKVEKNYNNALETLRNFEGNLKEDWQKEVLKSKIDGLPQDRQFSSDHDLQPVGDEVSFVGEFEDPHLLPTQKDHQWSDDTEESSGTMEDYHTYKGTVPQ